MKLKINTIYITVFLFTSFFFLWSVNLSFYTGMNLHKFEFIKNFIFTYHDRISVAPKYFILLLMIPIIFKLLKEIKFFSINKVFNNQKNILLLVVFILLHFFLIKIFTKQIIEVDQLLKLILLVLLSIIFAHYRFFIKNYFNHILLFFLVIFIFFGFYPTDYIYSVGQCNNEFFLLYFIENNFNLLLSKSVFFENSHLSIMLVPTLLSIILIITTSKKINFIYIFLFFLSTLVVTLNYSTTFFVCYLVSYITIFIFFHRKISIKFWIVTFLFLILNAGIFFSDKNCTRKVSDLSLKNILIKKIDKTHPGGVITRNLTTLIYERSAVLAIDTIQFNPFGWGFDGMKEATKNLVNKEEYKDLYTFAKILNLNDGLSSFFKILTEFGIFSIFILYFFIRYLLNLKKIIPYNFFIVILFITMSVRGVGYFNGGFIFCLFELFYIKQLSDKKIDSLS